MVSVYLDTVYERSGKPVQIDIFTLWRPRLPTVMAPKRRCFEQFEAFLFPGLKGDYTNRLGMIENWWPTIGFLWAVDPIAIGICFT